MDRYLQIKQMGQIYASAHLTIIAAVGTDPTYGLPGVSQRRNSRQTRIEQVGPVTLVQLMTRTARDVHQSTWATRGWTFQEGILSKRRLIFTDQAVLYICMKDYLHDLAPDYSSGLNYELLDLAEFLSCAQLPREIHSSAGSSRFKEALRYVTAYSRRNLGKSGDALNAIVGILNYLSNHKKEPIFHLWGVPLAPTSNGNDKIDLTTWESVNNFVYTTKEDHLQFALNWTHLQPSRRRRDFPSWSPLGWDGPIEYPTRYMDVIISNEFDVRIHPSNNPRDRPWLRPKLMRSHEIQYAGKEAISTKLEITSGFVAPIEISTQDEKPYIIFNDGTAKDQYVTGSNDGFEIYWDKGFQDTLMAEQVGHAHAGATDKYLLWRIGCKTLKRIGYHYLVLRLQHG
ncbi:hypothetical protein N0V90_004488 [Kalmusia sp. IMI 367209]|nr:hypothetical protein N0V90_004488 [Kalmusia sp. IMI 367209]